MTCLETQSKIIAYIDGNLEKDRRIEFLKHIQSCEDCKEELNIYYTMIEGMRQLDNNMPLTKDFSEELDRRISQELKQSRQKKGVVQSSFLMALIGIFTFAIIAYVNFLNLLHQEEQDQLKLAQGEYYFSESLSDYFFEPEEQELILNVKQDKTEMNFYEKIRYYNVVNEKTE